MLVIRRRAGQSIRIGDSIEIHIADLSPTRVTVAISAPREIAITRPEVTLTRAQNVAAADGLDPAALARLAGGLRLAP